MPSWCGLPRSRTGRRDCASTRTPATAWPLSRSSSCCSRSACPPGAFVWVHAQNEKDRELHVSAARRGAWVEFDGVGETSLDEHAALVLHMRAQGLLGRVLVSQDAGWYHVGEAGGGTFRPFTTMFERFLPMLRRAGLSAAEKRQLIVDNPREVLVPMSR